MVDDGVENRLKQMMCFKPVEIDQFGRFQMISKRILGLKQNGELWGLQGVMREIVGDLLEKYWFLDSFGADLGGRKWS